MSEFEKNTTGDNSYYIARTWDINGNETEDVWVRPPGLESIVEYIVESKDGSTFSILGRMACPLYNPPRWTE